MHLYEVTIEFVLRSASSQQTYTLTVYRFANSSASAIATVSSLIGAISNFAFSTGTNAGKKQLEVTETSATEITN